MAQRLIAEGKTPRIEKIVSDENYSFSLIPLIFRDSWEEGWAVHQVCCNDNLVYDPLLGQTVPVEGYCKIMFGRDIPMKTLISQKDMTEFLSK